MNSGIHILSAPIQTGKTTDILDWAEGNAGIMGILTPDINGIRVIYDLSNGNIFPLETNETNEKTIEIGRFSFLEEGFEQARQILQAACAAKPEWLVVDEIGKLEIGMHTGLEPEIVKIIRHYRYAKLTNNKLLLVIRDYLLDKAIALYSLNGATIISNMRQL